MRKIGTVKIRHRKLSENIIKDRGGVLDTVVALNQTRRFELGKGEGIDKLFQRHTVLQPYGHSDGEIIHHRPKACALFVHINENLSQ